MIELCLKLLTGRGREEIDRSLSNEAKYVIDMKLGEATFVTFSFLTEEELKRIQEELPEAFVVALELSKATQVKNHVFSANPQMKQQMDKLKVLTEALT